MATKAADALAKAEEVKTEEPKDALAREFDTYAPAVAKALPAGWTQERFMRGFLTMFRAVPKLAECDKITVLAGLMRMAQLGLSPNIHAYLIPFGKEAVFVMGYKGVVELVYRSGRVSNIHTDIVRDGDHFKVRGGSNAAVEHDYDLSPGREKREYTHVYSIVTFKDGSEDFEVMDVSEIAKVKNMSKAKGAEPWTKHETEMARKTVLMRHAKRLPMSDEDIRALNNDEVVSHRLVSKMSELGREEGGVYDCDTDDVIEASTEVNPEEEGSDE